MQLVEELSKTTAELQQDKAANQALTQELSNAKAESTEVSSRADELSAAVEERAADCTALQEQMSELRCEKQSTGNRWTIGTSDSCVSAAGTVK